MRRHLTSLEPTVLGAALLGLGLCASAVVAGTLSQELDDILDATPATEKISVIIPMTSQVDPNEVGGSLSGPGERLAEIVEALKTKATATQDVPICGRPGLVSELTALGNAQASNIRRLWAVNAVVVDAVPDVVRSTGARGDVGELHFAGDREVEVPASTSAEPQWNIAHVGAPTAWGHGFDGSGGIVASIDTGADKDHPDLAANLLVGPGDVPIWHDAVAGLTAPYDDDGHGTHLLGIAVGRNGYGVAPGAKWMSCKAFTRSGTRLVTTAARFLECAEWVLNPLHPSLTDTADPDPAYVPDVVMSDLAISGAGFCDPFLRDVIRSWRASRILPVWSVGDDPNGVPIGAVPSPANDPATFSVAAADENDVIAPTAFRGLAFCGGPTRLAPRLVAPGVNVTAAWPGGQRTVRDGSDVAAAHVAGAAALVRGARPYLRQVSVDILDEALERTGVPVADGQRRLDVDAAVMLQDAAFVDEMRPPSLVTGQTVPVTVTMKNAGVTSWTSPSCGLQSVEASPWGISSVPVESTVLPGEKYAFTFNVTAPMTPGQYPFQWHVCCDGTCFGSPSPGVPLVPVAGVDGATFDAQGVPCLQPGQTGTAIVPLRNTGTNPWTSPDYALGKLGNYGDQELVSLPPGVTVLPGATHAFLVPVTGPFPADGYAFQRRMRNGGTWFGEGGTVTFMDTHTCTPDISSMSSPFAAGPIGGAGEIRKDSSSLAGALMTNTGLTLWEAGYCLRVTSNAISSGLATSCLTGSQTVSPTQSSWFVTAITGSASQDVYGRWPLSLILYNNGGYPFGAGWSTTLGVPIDHQGGAEFANGALGQTQGHKNWFYRYYSGGDNTWKKMTWKTDHWEGSNPNQVIRETSVHPGTSSSVGRFWKSGTWGWVRASATVTDLDPSCGDGIVIRLRKNTHLEGEWILPNGGSEIPISKEICVNPDDTVRFIVTARNNNGCDTTQLDPLIQVLPPAHPATGPTLHEGTASNLVFEPAGVIP